MQIIRIKIYWKLCATATADADSAVMIFIRWKCWNSCWYTCRQKMETHTNLWSSNIFDVTLHLWKTWCHIIDNGIRWPRGWANLLESVARVTLWLWGKILWMRWILIGVCGIWLCWWISCCRARHCRIASWIWWWSLWLHEANASTKWSWTTIRRGLGLGSTIRSWILRCRLLSWIRRWVWWLWHRWIRLTWIRRIGWWWIRIWKWWHARALQQII